MKQTQAFNPDVVIVIKYDSTTGMTKLESGNGRPINSLTAAILAINVAKANMETFASTNQTLMPPHKFTALVGEEKCRWPRCGQPLAHEIHNVCICQCHDNGYAVCVKCADAIQHQKAAVQ